MINLKPAYTDNDMMKGAWAAFCQWALTEPEIRLEFKDETGIDLDNLFKASGINAAVDKATGRIDAAMETWAEWVTKTYWGVD